MSDMRYAQMATALLSRQQRPLPDSVGDRSAAVYLVEHALRGRARRRVWRNVGFSTAAAAVLAVGWGFALHTTPRLVERPVTPPARPAFLTATGHAGHGAGATLVRGTNAEALGPRVPLRAGDRLRARVSADLVVSLSTGTRLGLAGTGELALVRLDQVQKFDLPKGRLRADVAKLDAGQRFLINTSDSEIEVKGTSFEVTALDKVTCPDGSHTRVEVFEGTVTVRRGTGQPVYVVAGSTWPADCHLGDGGPAEVLPPPAVQQPAPFAAQPDLGSRRRRLAIAPRETPAPAPAPASAPAPALAPVPAPAPAPALARIEAPPPPAPISWSAPASVSESLAASTLAEQNDLFAGALQAHRDGDTASALRRLDELLTRFPGGPLAEGASHELRKLKAERSRHARAGQ
jgi:hypothetical protein